MRCSPCLLLTTLIATGACGAREPLSDGSGENGASSGGEVTSDEDDWDSDDWSDDPQPQVVSHEGAIERLGISGPETPWTEMGHEEREWYMVGKVLPIMKELFARQDRTHWDPSSFECATCHGDEGPEVGYAMPQQSLYRVPAPGTPAWQNMERIFPEVVTFMKETVTPTMGTLLGVEDYTCHHCHPGG